MGDHNQRGQRAGYAMARGEGAAADASVRRGGLGARGLVVGAALVVAMAVVVFLVVGRGGVTYAEATSVVVDLPADEVVVEFVSPDGCVGVSDDASVSAEGADLVLDLQVVEAVADGCESAHAFPLPLLAPDLPDEAVVTQVACVNEAITCGDTVLATVVRAR